MTERDRDAGCELITEVDLLKLKEMDDPCEGCNLPYESPDPCTSCMKLETWQILKEEAEDDIDWDNKPSRQKETY